MTKREKMKNFVNEHKEDIIRFSFYALGLSVGVGLCKWDDYKKKKEFVKKSSFIIDAIIKDTPVVGWMIDV